MKITPLTIDFDVTNAQEVEFVNELLNRLFGNAPFKATAAPAESPVTGTSAPLKATAAPTESPVTGTSVPTFSEPTQTAAPVQEAKEEPKQETITEAIAEVKKEMEKPVKVEKPKAAKEAPQATVEPEPVQAPAEEEKAPEKAENKTLTAKDMQAFMIDLMKSGKITRPQLTDIMLEFGGASLMRIKPEKYELLKQRIETYND